MANSSILLLLLLLLLPAATIAGRPAPASPDNSKKQKECLDGDAGTIAAGIGGITPGFGGIPSFTDLDHSGPAAASSRYIPGFDDTFVPNPGYEIPTSAAGGGFTTAP